MIDSDSFPQQPRGLGLVALAMGLTAFVLAALAPGALARNVYVVDFDPAGLHVIDGQANQLLGGPIAFGDGLPRGIAISPDGSTVYVSNSASQSVSVIDARAGRVVGSIPVGAIPVGIAVSPDGSRAFVANAGPDNVSVIDLRTNGVIATIDGVGELPDQIAISPDGGRVYVGSEGSRSLTIIDGRTNQVLGPPIPLGDEAESIAISPDGKRLYLTLGNTDTVAVLDTSTNQFVGLPIGVGNGPVSLDVSPDGRRAYVANLISDDVSVIDTAINQVIGDPIKVANGPFDIAIGGGRAFVSSIDSAAVTVIDIRTNQVVKTLAPVGSTPIALAIAPNKTPTAALAAPSVRIRPGVPATLDASASRDPDGTVASYSWAFGDGTSATVSTPTTTHVFARPGSYTPTLTVADEDNCPTGIVYTGQTVSCNGSAPATATLRLEVAYPGVRVRCPKSAKPKGCTIKLQVVAAKPKRGRKAKAQSATAKAELKAGRSAIVSLKAKKPFAAKLATAKTVLVAQTQMIAGKRTTGYRKLKIVR